MFIRLRQDCTTAEIQGRISADQFEGLRRTLTFWVPGFRFTPAYRRGLWDGRKCLVARDGTFPVGLVERVRSLFPNIEIRDERPALPWPSTVEVPSLHGAIPHPDQRLAILEFLRVGRGLLSMPTGAGKTLVAGAVLAALRPHRGLMLVNRKGLMAQTAARLRGYLSEPVGQLGGGIKDTKSRVTVATVQTLAYHLERYVRSFLPSQAGVIVDEAHLTCTGEAGFRVLGAIHAPVRLGLSATVQEASKRLVVEAYLGPVIHTQSLEESVATGRIARPRVTMFRLGGLVFGGDHNHEYTVGVVTNAERNNLLADATAIGVQHDLPVLVLVSRIEHGRLLRAACRERHGLDVPFLHGQTPIERIEEVKHDIEAGSLKAFIASTIFDVGQDVPSVRVIVIAGAMRSPWQLIQRIGRGMRRKTTGENVVDIFDVFDMSCDMLKHQAEDRQRTYKRRCIPITMISDLAQFRPARPFILGEAGRREAVR